MQVRKKKKNSPSRGLYFLETWTVYVCVCVCARRAVKGCVCVYAAAYLFHPGHSANTDSKEPLVVIQAITQLQKRKKKGGRGETEGEITAPGMIPDRPCFHSIIFSDSAAFWQVSTAVSGALQRKLTTCCWQGCLMEYRLHFPIHWLYLHTCPKSSFWKDSYNKLS